MAIIAGTQKTVFDPNVGFPGDQYGLPQSWLPSAGFVAASDIDVATFCWGINGSKTVTQAKGSNTQIAGFVLRSQASVIPYGDTNLGYGMTVPSGQIIAVQRNGNFFANITISFNGGDAINVGDQVFVNNTTGTLAVGVTAEPGYTSTDFIVLVNAVTNVNDLELVVISNTNTFLGN